MHPGTLKDGVIPYYELTAFESEFVATEWYIRGGETRYWRPDGDEHTTLGCAIGVGVAVCAGWYIEADTTE